MRTPCGRRNGGSRPARRNPWIGKRPRKNCDSGFSEAEDSPFRAGRSWEWQDVLREARRESRRLLSRLVVLGHRFPGAIWRDSSKALRLSPVAVETVPLCDLLQAGRRRRRRLARPGLPPETRKDEASAYMNAGANRPSTHADAFTCNQLRLGTTL